MQSASNEGDGTSGGEALADADGMFQRLDCRDVWGYDDHELVASYHDPTSGLRAYIAVHDTTLGPSLGGCRMWPYATEAEAISDVLRLAQGMSYKHAVAGTGQGGGKAVIVGDPHRDKSPEMFRAFGRFVECLEGRYITAEDVGMKVEDLCHAARCTRHVSGLPVDDGGSGDPSPVTAYGVFCGLLAAKAFQEGRPYRVGDRLDGVRVAVQGLGNVGYRLCQYLAEAGAQLTVADIFEQNAARAAAELQAAVVAPDEIIDADVDVFAPCALGGVLNAESIGRLRASIVGGAANNQLQEPKCAGQLAQRGILYAPDYVINAGGIINISHEKSGYDSARAMRHTEGIGDTLMEIFAQAAANKCTTAEVADDLARRRMGKA